MKIQISLILAVVAAFFLFSGFGLPDIPDPVEEIAEEVLPEPVYELYGLHITSNSDQESGVVPGSTVLDVGESMTFYVWGAASEENDAAWIELADSVMIGWEPHDKLTITQSDSTGQVVTITVVEGIGFWVIVKAMVLTEEGEVALNPDGDEIRSEVSIEGP